MNLTPEKRYQSDLTLPGFIYDVAQQLAVDKLQQLYDRLIDNQRNDVKKSIWRKISVAMGFSKQPESFH